ncbi:MAG: GAF domain-containing protein, partial [Bartonella sp.]|nr:GAF domain-containing protein [Bartonella sp.]
MRETHAGPRVILKRLREFMASAMDPQERLDLIVREIAQNMVAEVCSFYVLRSDGMLELFATKGLNPKAVHLSQLRLGQGLVGTIAATARPLNLTDAQKHPAFAYLPETGEEIYSSFLGVPILRAGRTLGVLVVQNRSQRGYSDDEVEALETVAMVLAEMIAAGDLPRATHTNGDVNMRRPFTLTAQSLNDGIGIGHVVLHEPRIVVTNLFNENSQVEIEKLTKAIGSLRLSIDDMLSRSDVASEGEHRDVLETYRMFANDTGWVHRLEEAINNGLTAEAAVEKVQSDTRARMIHLTDPYLRERLSDFDDLANRLLHQLMGRTRETIAANLPKDAVIVARSMGAAELLDYPRDRIRGLILEDGATTSHVTIVARAMSIPVVGQAKGVVSISENGDSVIIDGEDGRIYLRPVIDVERAYEEKARFRARKQQLYRDLRDVPSITKDGTHITLLMNAGLLV